MQHATRVYRIERLRLERQRESRRLHEMQRRVIAMSRSSAPGSEAQVDADRFGAEILVCHGGRNTEPASDLQETPGTAFGRRVISHFLEEALLVIGVVHL